MRTRNISDREAKSSKVAEGLEKSLHTCFFSLSSQLRQDASVNSLPGGVK